MIVTIIQPPHDKTNIMTVRQAKTQISLGIRSVWSVFAVRMQKALVLSYPLSVQQRLIRLVGGPGWSESSLGAHAILLVLSWGGSIILFGKQFHPTLKTSDSYFNSYLNKPGGKFYCKQSKYYRILNCRFRSWTSHVTYGLVKTSKRRPTDSFLCWNGQTRKLSSTVWTRIYAQFGEYSHLYSAT